MEQPYTESPGDHAQAKRSNPRHRPQKLVSNTNQAEARPESSSAESRAARTESSGRKGRRPPRQSGFTDSGGLQVSEGPNWRRTGPVSNGDIVAGSSTADSGGSQAPRVSRRGAKFNPGLTDRSSSSRQNSSTPKATRRSPSPESKRDDLTSRLIRALSAPPYPDCPICFNSIRPAQPTWSCSPSPFANQPNATANAQCCWTTFHLKCIRSWAAKSVKEVEDAWRARGEEHTGEWRCPGCQSKRDVVPSGYWCFCGSTPEPSIPRLSTPHSCANSCSRPRSCGHPCPLVCHPGPCPPCNTTREMACHCGARTLSFKCSQLAKDDATLSCGNACGKKLACGNHICTLVCHEGGCAPCEVREVGRCYCGKDTKDLGCGGGIAKDCSIDGGAAWVGKFECGNECGRPFDCNVHFCSKLCHPPSSIPPPCPRSPSLVIHCPCGKHPLGFESSAPFFPPNTKLIRTKCTDPIPSCNSTCLKPLSGCAHVCSSKCHIGQCPPCSIMVVRPCRCGAITRDIRCSSLQSQPEVLCDKPCQALRACGRHQCGRLCCPLASIAVSKGKGKKRPAMENVLDEGRLHECDFVCGRLLGCGNHRCEERDHRGACPPCLRSSFQEMICYCNQTILDPPIPCGTRINCTYQCTREPPACGHPRAQHTCHEDPITCPPCPFLTSRICACGKKSISNVRCSQEKVTCGTPCGKLLACGFHHCERLCHGDECGECTSICKKPRKLCLPKSHPCLLPCHAPSSCPEHDSCTSLITIHCPCGRIEQSVQCGRSTANPAGREVSLAQHLKCTSECLVAKRNARLADALGINPEGLKDSKDKAAVYSDELVSFAKANLKFLGLVEKTFAEFVSSEKKTQVLPHMPADRRKFVHDLAAVYRIDTQMVDQEPHRSVQLIRRIDTRIPTPVLSSASASAASTPFGANLGKLSDMRQVPHRSSSPAATAPFATAPLPSTWTTTFSGQQSWRAVVARPVAHTPPPSVNHVPTSQNERKGPPVGGDERKPALHPAGASTFDAMSPSVPDNWEDEA